MSEMITVPVDVVDHQLVIVLVGICCLLKNLKQKLIKKKQQHLRIRSNQKFVSLCNRPVLSKINAGFLLFLGAKKMKLIMNFEVSKGYETWKKAFLDNEPMRQRHNINLLAYGHADDNENNVYSVIEIPAMEVMQDMLKDPDMVTLRESAGVILETQSMIKLVE